MAHSIRIPLFFILFSFVLFTCTKDKGKMGNGYPEEISRIIVTKCATPGCHTQTSKDAAAGLSLETWDDMFRGDRNGAVCIPFSHGYSTLFLYTNTDTALGAVNMPTMPLNKPSLSKQEINTLIDWIDKGAPTSDGKIAFAGNPSRNKIYVTNQGCDVVTVFDAAAQLQMRYVQVGASVQIESPHMIKVSPDGKYWYVVFSNAGTVLQKYRASDDVKEGELSLGTGSWNTFTISNDSRYGFAVDWNTNGRVAYVDLNTMSLLGGSPWTGFADAHGSALNGKGDTLYVTAAVGNYIHKIPVNDPSSFTSVILNPPAPQSTSSQFDPHDIAFSPDSLYYYVSCPKSNEVRVMRVSDDGLEMVLPTGEYPLEMAFSKTRPFLFITCEKDITPPGTNRGSVTVVDYTTNTVLANLRTNMSEPHGIAVDDAHNLVYVANRNISSGVIPHHSTNCGGTNGFMSFIDMKPAIPSVIPDKKVEVAVDPYSVAVRP